MQNALTYFGCPQYFAKEKISNSEVVCTFQGSAKDNDLTKARFWFSTVDLEKPELILAQCEEHKGKTAAMLSVAPSFVKKTTEDPQDI